MNVVDLLLDAVCIVDVDSRIVFVSPAFERIFGYAPEEAVGLRMLDLVHPDDREVTSEQAHRIMQGTLQLQFENRYIRKDGSVAHILWTARWLPERQLRIAVAHDITERKRTESMHSATYAISEAAHNAIDLPSLLGHVHCILEQLISVRSFRVALYEQDGPSVRFAYSSPPAVTSCQRAKADETWHESLCLRAIQQGTALFASSQDGEVAEATGVHQGGLTWLCMPLPSSGGPKGALLLESGSNQVAYSLADKDLLQFVSTQISLAIERTQMHERLKQMAQFDQLTQLPNRALFNDRLQMALSRARRDGLPLSLLFIDLDRFKEVNDTLGHAAGDVLLQSVARRLAGCVRSSDTVARLGGDEFVVLLEGAHAGELPHHTAHKILSAFSHPFSVHDKSLSIQPSIGVAVFPDHGATESTLLSHADEAMYHAKRQGGNQFMFHPKRQRQA
ncbi:GGDEF domain-containing protein [Acidovorax sp. DW039]|uniref:diguanylate cyclase domain-containing protein n=1 Tax=Acidovorax sp. DW039 TaxID=3095606 RepID=UPI00309011CD|nr:GGDEF domain-containing protein [Acidovorax sp. DW039]